MTVRNRIAKMDKLAGVQDYYNLAEKCFPIFVDAFEKSTNLLVGQSDSKPNDFFAKLSDERLYEMFNNFLSAVQAIIRYDIPVKEVSEEYNVPSFFFELSLKFLTKNLPKEEIIMYLD